jgi:hypothetical protein
MSTSISSICWKRWNLETKNRFQMSMLNLTIWLKSCERWRWMSTIWLIACFSRVNETILNRVKIINRICLRVILFQINRSCSIRDHSRCFFRICLFKICRFRLCYFWTMKLRVRLLLNVFIVTKRIICTKKNVLSSTRIWELRKFIYKKREFISSFIILMRLSFEWSFTKVNDNALRMLKSWHIRIASSQLRSRFTLCVWERTRILNFRSTRKKKSDVNESRILRQCRRHSCDNSIKV